MTAPSSTRSVFLIGFMGAGKTSVGRELARRTGCPFYDLDQVIEAREKATVDEIFAAAGEQAFRRAEHEALLALMQRELGLEHAIVALGGGAFAQPENRRALQQAEAFTVLLEAPVEELERRCRSGPDVRPLARDRERFRRLFAERREAYGEALYRIETAGRTIEQVADEIEQLLGYGEDQKAVGGKG